jgi:DNA-binding response OmpR family regulator
LTLQKPLEETNGTNRSHLLLVEDDTESCEMLRHVLADWDLTLSHTIAGAMSFYLERHFDLFLLDNWLPDGSGIELCRELRSRYPETPIVFMSAAAHESTIEQANAAGADRYFVKPFDPYELRGVVKELLEPSASEVKS